MKNKDIAFIKGTGSEMPTGILNGTGGANPDNILHAVAVIQLVGVDADGGHTHAGGHDGNLHAFVGAGMSLDAPDIIDQHRVFQKVFRDEFGPQGVAGHQDGFAEIAGSGADVGSGSGKHGCILLINSFRR